MRNFGYYTDFVIFPVVLVALIAAMHRYGGDIYWMDAGTAIFVGVLLWTFLEYSIHRFILHNGLIFSAEHAAHHADPKATIGTPTWLTLLLMIFGIYLPSVFMLRAGLGLRFSFGFTSGYLVYSFAHYVLHQWDVRNNRVFNSWKRIHGLHHFAVEDRNFGVTSSLWDHVFGTAAGRKSRRGWPGQARP